MTREDIKKALPILQAFAEGKTIQHRQKDTYQKWITINDTLVLNGTYEYRIKSEPTYRPFKNAEECWKEMQKHQPFGWIRNKKNKAMEDIRMLTFDTEVMPIYVFDNKHTSLTGAFEMYTFADGAPFGVKEKE